MNVPPLIGPTGVPISPQKSFLVDGYGNPLSPADKDFALPTYLTVSSIISGGAKTFLALSYDEALKHSRQNALAMFRDARIVGWVQERISSVINLKWHLEVEDERDPLQKCVKDGLTTAMKRIPRFKRILRALMWALWFGRSASEVCWRWETMNLPTLPQQNLFAQMGQDMASGAFMNGQANGQMANGQMNGQPQDLTETQFPLAPRPVLMPFKSQMLNGDKINYTWAETPMGAPAGTPLVRVYAAAGAELDDAEIVYDNMGPLVVLNGPWRERFLIHNFNQTDADYFMPEMAGGIYGVGIRSVIYWANWIRMEYAAWIQDLFDRVGLGFIVIKYDMASARAKTEAETAAKKWNRRSVLAVPVTADQLQKAGSIEVVEVPTTGAVVVQELVKYYDRMIERYILRQTMSGGGSGGDGVRGTIGPAEMAKNTEFQRIMEDAEELAETITGSDDEPGLVSVMKKWTYPGADFPVQFKFDIEAESAKEKLQAATIASALGVTFGETWVRGLTGAPTPQPGEKTVGGMNKVNSLGEEQSTKGKEGGEQGGDNAGDKARSVEAAEKWVSSGKLPGTLNQIAEEFGVTRQAVGQAAKHLEGGGA